MKHLYSPVCLLFMLCACQSQEVIDDFEEIHEKNFDIEQIDGIRQNIAVNILTSRYGGYQKGSKSTRAINEFSLTPLVLDGDTALYVAQYQEGWEIYSTSLATKMVLFSSDKGVFNINAPQLPPALKTLILNSGNMVSHMKESEVYTVDSSWGGYAFCHNDGENCTISSLTPNGTYSTVNSEDVPPGYWVLIASTPIDESFKVSPKNTETLWDQTSPWNKYAKKVPNDKGQIVTAPAGCVPVTLSQLMYVTHFKDGIPKTSVTTAILNSAGNDYTFSGESSTVWDKMAKSRYVSGTDNTALLIGKVGHDLKATYEYNSTGVTPSNLVEYMNKVYGIPFVYQDFDLTTTLNYLDSGYPIVSTAARDSIYPNGKKETIRHAFLIDRYRLTTNRWKYTYGRVRYPLPPETIDPWMMDVTDEEGNIIQYAYTKEEIQDYQSYAISMNWGTIDGIFDHVFQSPFSAWYEGSKKYDLEHKIIVKK